MVNLSTEDVLSDKSVFELFDMLQSILWDRKKDKEDIPEGAEEALEQVRHGVKIKFDLLMYRRYRAGIPTKFKLNSKDEFMIYGLNRFNIVDFDSEILERKNIAKYYLRGLLDNDDSSTRSYDENDA